ncbi:Transposable element Tcb1 transposase [Dictyocoela muelleri]|nr:Transposable element Tcb1 transposase [Dictyocoela muelleri]
MQLSQIQRGKIISLYQENFTQKEISEKMKINQSTVSRVLKKYKKYGVIENLKGCGRRKVINSSDLKILKNSNNKNPKSSLRKMSSDLLKLTGKQVSHMTIKNVLNDNGVFAYSPIKKPLLSKKNIKSRIEKAENFVFMSDDEIKNIIFSDESKFNLFYSDGRVSVWREPSTGLKPKNLIPTVKYGGGSVMVWGCFSYHGVGKLVFIDGIMDSASYVNILTNNLNTSARIMGLESYTFQQDNDPKHTSKLAKRFFSDKNIKLLPWPAQSPDLNPIETLWAIIKQKLAKFTPKNKNELKALITEEWNSISLETCQKLAMSFKKRALGVYRARGHHIKY